MLSTADLKVRLEGTLTSLENDLQHIDNEIHALNKKLDAAQQKLKAFKKTGKAATEDAITKKIEKLHFEHKTKSMSLKQEKALLREIENLKAGIRNCQENALLEESVKQMLNQRHELIEKRKMKTSIISEANMGLQKLTLAEYSGISPGDLASTALMVEKDKVKHVMGRQYAILKRLEEEHHVVVEVQKNNAEDGNPNGGEQSVVLIITGTTENCNAAKYHIDSIARSTGVTVNIGEDVAAVLKLQHPGTEQTHADIIGLACGVTIIGSPEKYSITIRGIPESIEKAKNMIQSVNYCSIPILVDARDLPVLLGTKGTKIRQLEKEQNVRINIKRDAISTDKEEDGSYDQQQNDNSLGSPTHEITILGSAEDVKSAVNAVQDVIADNELIEKCIELPFAYLCFLLRNPSKGWLRDIERKVRFIRLSICEDEGEYGIVRCSGPKDRISEALPLVHECISLAQLLTERVDLPPNSMGAIIGKKGTTIKNMRKAHPAVEIMLDADRNVVFFHSEDESARTAVRKSLMEIISLNCFETIELGSSMSSLLKMKSSTKIRDSIEALKVRMDIVGDIAGTIHLWGEGEAIQEAMKKLLEFKASNQFDIFKLDPENASTFSTSLLNELRQKIGVIVHLLKDKQELHLYGSSEHLAEAMKFVHDNLYGDEEGGSVAFVKFEPEICGLLIGKGGNRITKMREEYGVAMEIINHKNPKVRLRGDPKKVADAKAKLTEFVEIFPISSTVHFAGSSRSHADILAHCETVSRMFKISVFPDQEGKYIQLRGVSRRVVAARSWLQGLLKGKACIMLPIWGAISSVNDAVYVTGRLNVEWCSTDRFSDDVQIKLVSEESGGITISFEGEPLAVQKAVKLAYKFLESSFQGRFASVYVVDGALDSSIAKPCSMNAAIKATEGKVEVFADWMFNCVRVRGENAGSVSAVVDSLETVAKEWMASNSIVTFEKWMTPHIIGKRGLSIKEFSEKHSVMVRVDPMSLCCFVTDPRKTQSRAFDDSSYIIPNEEGRGSSDDDSDGVINVATSALREITDKLYEINGVPLPDPQGFFAEEKGSEALKGVESRMGISCVYYKGTNSVVMLGNKAAVLEARAALKDIMESGIEEEKEEQTRESSKSGVHPPVTTARSVLLSKRGCNNVSVTSPPSSANELPTTGSPISLEHPVAEYFGATEGGITTTSSSLQTAAAYTDSSHPVVEFYYQTEMPQPLNDATVAMDAHYSAREKEKQKPRPDYAHSVVFGETNPSISAVSEDQLPKPASSLPDRRNVEVRGSETIGGRNASEESAVHKEKGSWYFKSLNGLNVRLS